MLSFGPVHTDFDFESRGKRSGVIDLSFSDDVHAFSTIRIPVGIICGDAGPTILLTAGSHGDEYEGQVILQRLMQELNPQDLQGRIILLPALNLPAVQARTRVSPLDQGNMNRCFGKDAKEGPTAAIAAFVKTQILPMADVVLDYHSGGSASAYVDCGFICIGPNAALNSANVELAKVFGAPFTMVDQIDGNGGDFDTAAHVQGCRFLACELGGSGRFSPTSFDVGWQATLRVLAHLKITVAASEPAATRLIDIGAHSRFFTAAHHGLVQMHVRVGASVQDGTHLATLFDLHNFGTILAEFHADRAGVIAITLRSPLVSPGDHLCLLSEDVTAKAVLQMQPSKDGMHGMSGAI